MTAEAFTRRALLDGANLYGGWAVLELQRRRVYDQIRFIPVEAAERAEAFAREAWRYAVSAENFELGAAWDGE